MALDLVSKDLHGLINPIKEKHYVCKYTIFSPPSRCLSLFYLSFFLFLLFLLVFLFILFSLAHYYCRLALNGSTKTMTPQKVRIPFVMDIPSSAVTVHFITCAWKLPTLTFPPSVTTIFFADCPQPVDHLPHSITSLSFRGELTFPLDHLPPSLKILNINCRVYNRPLDHLPNSLTNLVISANNFDHPLDHLPPTLKTLTSMGRVRLLDHLPPSLTHLHLSKVFWRIDYLPASLSHLIVDYCVCSFYHLPSSLLSLEIRIRKKREVHQLPPTLTCLRLSKKFNHAIDYLPPSLTSLFLAENFKKNVDHLPPSLQRLEFCDGLFNKPIDYLPPSLTRLIIAGHFDQPIDNLPPGNNFSLFPFPSPPLPLSPPLPNSPPIRSYCARALELCLQPAHRPPPSLPLPPLPPFVLHAPSRPPPSKSQNAALRRYEEVKERERGRGVKGRGRVRGRGGEGDGEGRGGRKWTVVLTIHFRSREVQLTVPSPLPYRGKNNCDELSSLAQSDAEC